MKCSVLSCMHVILLHDDASLSVFMHLLQMAHDWLVAVQGLALALWPSCLYFCGGRSSTKRSHERLEISRG